jgi:hypothetical protein
VRGTALLNQARGVAAAEARVIATDEALMLPKGVARAQQVTIERLTRQFLERTNFVSDVLSDYGGKVVIFFGDLAQLYPVVKGVPKQELGLHQIVPVGDDLVIELTEMKRCKCDRLAQLLDELRVQEQPTVSPALRLFILQQLLDPDVDLGIAEAGKILRDDPESRCAVMSHLLQERVVQASRDPLKPRETLDSRFISRQPIVTYVRGHSASRFCMRMVSGLPSPAAHQGYFQRAWDRLHGGLQKTVPMTLELAVNDLVMLQLNISHSRGLNNGTVGKVSAFVREKDERIIGIECQFGKTNWCVTRAAIQNVSLPDGTLV